MSAYESVADAVIPLGPAWDCSGHTGMIMILVKMMAERGFNQKNH